MNDLAEHLFQTAVDLNEVQMVEFRRAEATKRDLLCLVQQLRDALVGMVKEHEELRDNTEGRYPHPDSGCIECTVGCVPDRLNTGLCAYHHAKRLLNP